MGSKSTCGYNFILDPRAAYLSRRTNYIRSPTPGYLKRFEFLEYSIGVNPSSFTTFVTLDHIIALVAGATGHQGGSTARESLNAGIKVHALVRDPSSKPAIELQRRRGEEEQRPLKETGLMTPGNDRTQLWIRSRPRLIAGRAIIPWQF
jgi:hypothetical protein